jgi:2-oxoglutarate dehydrogenase E2 component (dihydrolipoamide succinyltransferase)
MPTEIRVPEIGESITEVQIAEWRKAEGDPVEKDETIVTLDSEKATVELPAPATGTLTRILKSNGEDAKVGDTIGEIDDKAEDTPPTAPRRADPRSAPGKPGSDATDRGDTVDAGAEGQAPPEQQREE